MTYSHEWQRSDADTLHLLLVMARHTWEGCVRMSWELHAEGVLMS